MTWTVSVNLLPQFLIMKNDFVSRPRVSSQFAAVDPTFEYAGKQSPEGRRHEARGPHQATDRVRLSGIFRL